ncbi:hypothetical protein J437_LFUL004422 [Ladona fulva]|uniref:C2H2-type domain-containing protein n=1 Tax=Ladona fulva TaxID=123851 RepID=A0A8K0NVQ8_LADFU|nr:hypothetical protein J437_LFUL004422 [Ladona fulva]
MGGHSDAGEGSCDEAKSKSGVLHLTSGPYKCEYAGCQASFKKPSRLKQHICSHTGERPFKCDKPNCSKAYTHSCHLRRHIAKSHTPQLYKVTFKCEECEANFDTASNLRRHLRSHKTHTCNIYGCKEKFSKWTELLKHVKAVHPLEYICDVCGLKFKVKGNLRQHVRTHMKDRPSYLCPYPECSRSYSRTTYLKNHIKWKHQGTGGHKCTFNGCLRILSTKAKLVKHLAWHERDGRHPKKKEGSKRKPRSDKGIAKRSMATLLSGLPSLPPPIEKKIINGESLESDEDIPLQVLDEIDQICSENVPVEQTIGKPEENDLGSYSSEDLSTAVKLPGSC